MQELQDEDEEIYEDEADLGGGAFLPDKVDEDPAVEVALDLFAGGGGGGEGMVEKREEGGGDEREEDGAEVGGRWIDWFRGEGPELREGGNDEAEHGAAGRDGSGLEGGSLYEVRTEGRG